MALGVNDLVTLAEESSVGVPLPDGSLALEYQAATDGIFVGNQGIQVLDAQTIQEVPGSPLDVSPVAFANGLPAYP